MIEWAIQKYCAVLLVHSWEVYLWKPLISCCRTPEMNGSIWDTISGNFFNMLNTCCRVTLTTYCWTPVDISLLCNSDLLNVFLLRTTTTNRIVVLVCSLCCHCWLSCSIFQQQGNSLLISCSKQKLHLTIRNKYSALSNVSPPVSKHLNKLLQ